MTASYIFDHSDFCRRCKGTGTDRLESPTGSTVAENCPDCGGTGSRAVRITGRAAPVQPVPAE